VTSPQVIAHRGSSAHHPDNSWAAFEAAVAEGADAIECDVQATRDGALIVRHDLALGDRLVCDLTVTELEAAEPGTIRLVDLFDWVAQTTAGLLIEVKDPEAAEAVGAMVATNPAWDRTVVGGFHGPALAAAKVARPRVRTSFMIGSVMGAEELIRLATAYRVDGVHLCWEARAPRPHVLLDAPLIQRLRRNGLTTTLWHEEREEELRLLVALEPDAICTNTPAGLRRIVDAHRMRREDVGRATTT
jgi:glycerophosphoryl diester phosphodiesterase